MHSESRISQTTQHQEAPREKGIWRGHLAIAVRLLSLILGLPLLTSGGQGIAQLLAPDLTVVQASDQAPKGQTTLVVFTEKNSRRMTDQQWDALVAALREELDSDLPELQVLVGKKVGTLDYAAGTSPVSQIQIIRGDQLAPGLSVENPIAIFLHGECRILPQPPPILFDDTQVSGTLGWVKSDRGRIEPFVHVECDRLAQMLATEAFGRNREQRDNLMAVAVARVILHEWIHIATQSRRHSGHGLAKAQFGPADLAARTAHSTVHRGAE
jgi:hypothetical protein